MKQFGCLSEGWGDAVFVTCWGFSLWLLLWFLLGPDAPTAAWLHITVKMNPGGHGQSWGASILLDEEGKQSDKCHQWRSFIEILRQNCLHWTLKSIGNAVQAVRGEKKYLLAHTFTQLLPCNILQVIAYFVCHNVSLNISDECSSGLQTKCTPTLPAGLFVQAACTSDAVRMWRRWRFRCFCIIMMCQLTRCRLTKGPPWLRVRVIHPVRLHLHFPLLSSRSQSGQCLLLCPCGWLCTFRISLNSIFFSFFALCWCNTFFSVICFRLWLIPSLYFSKISNFDAWSDSWQTLL